MDDGASDSFLRTDDGMDHVPTHKVWIFQANPKRFRILDARQRLNQMPFLVTRYKDQISVGDMVLVWMSGSHAGIYAQARVVEGVRDRTLESGVAEFWVDTSNGSSPKPRVMMAIERRFLGNPLLRSTIKATEGLAALLILRQAAATNFPVEAEEWEHLRRLLPVSESIAPSPPADSSTTRRTRGGLRRES